MMVRITLEAMITLPEGTTRAEGRAFTLPNGDTVKPWVALELNDLYDLTYTQVEERGIEVDEGLCAIDVIGGAA